MEIKRIFWIGDSTVQTNLIDTWPQCGMGQVLSLYLRGEIAVCNHAKNGRSTKSFRDEGLWAPVEAALGPGDLLLVEFGHNDEKEQDPTRYADPETYAANVEAFCRTALERGALAVAVTPLTRRRFGEDGRLQDTHGPYPDALRAVAARRGLPLVDLTAASRALVEALGEAESRRLYMNLAPGEEPRYPQGLEDNTHLRGLGAVRFAGLVARGLRALGGAYGAVLLPPEADPFRETGTNEA